MSANQLGRAYGTYVQQHGLHRALIGRDIRLSSPRISKGLAEGILATGCDVIDLGMVPTPVFYYSFLCLRSERRADGYCVA